MKRTVSYIILITLLIGTALITAACGTREVTVELYDGVNEESTVITSTAKDFSIDVLPTPKAEGHTFLGWYTDEECTVLFDGEIARGTSYVKLYAGYEVNTYTVRVYEGTKATEYNFRYGEEISLPTLEDTSYAFFGGYFLDTSFETELLNLTMPSGDIKVYVKRDAYYEIKITNPFPEAITSEGGALLQFVTPTAPHHTAVKLAAPYGYAVHGYRIDGELYEFGEDACISLDDVRRDTVVEIVADYAVRDIPVVDIKTVDGAPIVNKVDYVDMSFSLSGSDCDLSADGGIRYRGNSTFSFPKKPYRIKFDKKQSLFGLTAAKSWVLLADYLDPSGLHNYTAFSLAEDASFKFTATANKVNLYINGEYKGLFTLCEQIQENPGRIDIEKDITEDMVNLFDYNFFIAMDRKVIEDPTAVEGETYFILEEYGKYIELKYPEKSDFASDEQFESFFSQLQVYCSELFKMFTERDTEKILETVNIDTLIDFMIIDQIMGEKDHRENSFNMFYTTTSGDENIDGRLSFGPIWDYDWCFNSPWNRIPYNLFELSDSISYSNVFYQAVAETSLMELVKARFEDYYIDKIGEVAKEIAALGKSMEASLIQNERIWYPDEEGLSVKNVDFLVEFILHRRDVLSKAWGIAEDGS